MANSDQYIKPTESELEILQVLWSEGNATVRKVHEAMAGFKDAGYTTTLKLLQIMHEKGLVGRDDSGKSHIYFALASKEKTQQQFLGKMMNEISDSIPRGVWLREIRYDGALLSIKGSAVSKVNNEVIIAGDFVTALKEKPAITEHFMGLQLESIERRENSVAAIVDFLLKAKMKVQ